MNRLHKTPPFLLLLQFGECGQWRQRHAIARNRKAVFEKRLLRCSRYEHKVNGWKNGKSAAFMIVQKLHEHKPFEDFPSGKAVKVHRRKAVAGWTAAAKKHKQADHTNGRPVCVLQDRGYWNWLNGRSGITGLCPCRYVSNSVWAMWASNLAEPSTPKRLLSSIRSWSVKTSLTSGQ